MRDRVEKTLMLSHNVLVISRIGCSSQREAWRTETVCHGNEKDDDTNDQPWPLKRKHRVREIRLHSVLED